MFDSSRPLSLSPRSCRQGGAVAVLVIVAMLPLLGFAALAVDVSNIMVARNELQNAADAGALAGARCLYNQTDPLTGPPPQPPAFCQQIEGANLGHVNTNANTVARQAAMANDSRKTAVEVYLTDANGPDVERGHWNPTTRTFTPNDSTDPADLANRTTAELNADVDFINAVRVTARRQATPVEAFFSRVFGFTGFDLAADAIAWIGFATFLMPGEADQPIAICDNALRIGGVYQCSVGRMVPSPAETGGWITFEQAAPEGNCPNTNTGDIQAGICSGGNQQPLQFGWGTAMDNGQKVPALEDLEDCWTSETGRTAIWSWTLPVLDCAPNFQQCPRMVGAVNVDVVWISNGNPNKGKTFDCATDLDNKPGAPENAPCQMGDWGGPNEEGTGPYYMTSNNERWNDFADHFDLMMADGRDATVENGGWTATTIYFKPSCEPNENAGGSGGENFGILAKIPKLVE